MSTDAGYRVLFMLRLRPGTGDEFVREYEKVRWQAADVPGHLRDQLCQSSEAPDQWLITSEWRTAEDFLAWERTPAHRELAAPMMRLVAERQSLRYVVRRQTERTSA